jgi:hypothetical protein
MRLAGRIESVNGDSPIGVPKSAPMAVKERRGRLCHLRRRGGSQGRACGNSKQAGEKDGRAQPGQRSLQG